MNAHHPAMDRRGLVADLGQDHDACPAFIATWNRLKMAMAHQ